MTEIALVDPLCKMTGRTYAAGAMTNDKVLKMDRLEILREGISKTDRGIEIGPWFNPVVPKREGYNTLTVDVFDAETLRQRAIADPAIDNSLVANIEEVDFVCKVDGMMPFAKMKGVLGQIDYIVSSHNMEHLPNPVQFLRDASEIIKPGGSLIMALPDKRLCFDHFRPHSTTAEFIEAYLERRVRPSFAQIFSYNIYHAYNNLDGQLRSGWVVNDHVDGVTLHSDAVNYYYDMAKANSIDPSAEYIDAHCWTFTPSSFELIMTELNLMRSCDFGLERVLHPGGHEFFVHLRAARRLEDVAGAAVGAKRNDLLIRINDEIAMTSRAYRERVA